MRFLPILRLVIVTGGSFADFAAAALAASSRLPLVVLRVRYCLVCPDWVCGAACSCVVVGGGEVVVDVGVIVGGGAGVVGEVAVVVVSESVGDGWSGEGGDAGVVGVCGVAMRGIA